MAMVTIMAPLSLRFYGHENLQHMCSMLITAVVDGVTDLTTALASWDFINPHVLENLARVLILDDKPLAS